MPTEAAAPTQVLEISQSGAARQLTLNRPAALNTFDPRLQHELRAAVDDAARDDSVRALVLTGRGRAFSAGADLSLDDLRPEVSLAGRTERELRMFYNPTIRALRTMDKPVIAAVNGSAVGLGCALAMACDQVLAAESAWFSLAFAKVGLTLDAGASLMIGARIGIGRTAKMAMLGSTVDAATAHEWGMVDEIVPDADLQARASALAQILAAGPTAAFAATKRSLNTALLSTLDATFEIEIDGQTTLVDSVDFREGVAAFTSRRAPHFIGR